MSDERWRVISRLYDEAAALAPVDRAPFLRKACGGDESLRAEIESLLRDDSRVNALLEPKASHTALIGQRIGGYEIRSLLGVGGMGEVYRARDPKLGRDVAIKVLPAGFASDGERLARFQREARLLASLNHPHIGGIHGFEDASGVPALVLELVEGDTLAERLEKGPIPVSEALHIARQIADALETAHEHGVVHRDLKPANIKITPQGTVKVLDFGLAKAVQRAESPLQTSGLSHEGIVRRHAGVYESRAGARTARRSARRHLGVWLRVVRDAHGPRRVRRCDGDRHARRGSGSRTRLVCASGQDAAGDTEAAAAMSREGSETPSARHGRCGP